MGRPKGSKNKRRSVRKIITETSIDDLEKEKRIIRERIRQFEKGLIIIVEGDARHGHVTMYGVTPKEALGLIEHTKFRILTQDIVGVSLMGGMYD